MLKTKDPLILATTKVSVAKVAFTAAADQLDEAADHLAAIATEAVEESTRQSLRAGTARAQAADATRSANRIRELLG